MKGPLEVRNINPEVYTDPDWMAYHAFFTCLCTYVEDDREGEEKFEEYIKLIRDDCVDLWQKFPELHKNYDGKLEKYMDERLEPHEKTLELYRWYTQYDWEQSFLMTNNKVEELTSKLKEAADIMWCW